MVSALDIFSNMSINFHLAEQCSIVPSVANSDLGTIDSSLSTPEDAYQGGSLRQFSQITLCLLLFLKLSLILLHVLF